MYVCMLDSKIMQEVIWELLNIVPNVSLRQGDPDEYVDPGIVLIFSKNEGEILMLVLIEFSSMEWINEGKILMSLL